MLAQLVKANLFHQSGIYQLLLLLIFWFRFLCRLLNKVVLLDTSQPPDLSELQDPEQLLGLLRLKASISHDKLAAIRA